MVSIDDRRTLTRRRPTRTVRRREVPAADEFLPGPDPLEDDRPPVPVRRIVRKPRPRPRPRPRPSTEDSRPSTRDGWTWPVRVLALVLLAAIVGTGWVAKQWYDGRQDGAARQAALAAARQETTNFVSISASTVDSDMQRIADGATGDFKDEFTRDMAQVRAAVVGNKVTSVGTVLRAAVVSADRRTAVVLVAVDATVKNASAPDGRLSHYRIQVSLAHDAKSGRWLVSQLQFVG